jgi:ubiquinone/menaquinone biosynthesis C-methylase UbiE
VTEEGRSFSFDRIQRIYDRAYTHDGLMGTDLDGTYDRQTKEILLGFAGPLPGKRLLDLGTGIGNLWAYVPAGVEGHACDLSAIGVRRAALRFPQVTVSVSIAESIPYPDAFFDILVAADTIEHTFWPQMALQEIHRVLKPGGVLCASFPTPNSLRKWGWNQFLTGHPNLKLLGGLIRVLVKRILLFGRPDFQPIDRDLKIEDWVQVIERAGLHVDQVLAWPERPKLPIVTLLRAVRSSTRGDHADVS